MQPMMIRHAGSTTYLPVVLLGIRSALKDLGYTAAEMVYGQPLRLPGELFTPSPVPTLSVQQRIIRDLQTTFSALRPSAQRIPSNKHVFVSPHFQSTTHVFLTCLRWTLQGSFSLKEQHYFVPKLPHRSGCPRKR